MMNHIKQFFFNRQILKNIFTIGIIFVSHFHAFMLQAPVNLDLGCIVIILKMNLEVKLNLKVHRFIIVFEPHHYASWLLRTLKGKAVVGTAPTRHLPVRIQPYFRGETNHSLPSGCECLVSASLLIGQEVHLAFESTALKEFWDSWAFGPTPQTNPSCYLCKCVYSIVLGALTAQ